MVLKPKLDWKPFDISNPPDDLSMSDDSYLILIADYGYNPTEDTVPNYYTDIATAYGSYIDDFWNTSNDWGEGQVLHVVSYYELFNSIVLDKSNDVVYLCDNLACKMPWHVKCLALAWYANTRVILLMLRTLQKFLMVNIWRQRNE